MDINDPIEIAQKYTKIIKARKNILYTFGATRLPYICISQNKQNENEIENIIRTGEVNVEKPQIAIPGEYYKFEGFENDDDDDEKQKNYITIMLARSVSIPPANYSNKAVKIHREKGNTEEIIEKIVEELEKNNDKKTAVIQAPENVWNISLILYVSTQVAKSAQENITEHFERLRIQGYK